MNEFTLVEKFEKLNIPNLVIQDICYDIVRTNKAALVKKLQKRKIQHFVIRDICYDIMRTIKFKEPKNDKTIVEKIDTPRDVEMTLEKQESSQDTKKPEKPKSPKNEDKSDVHKSLLQYKEHRRDNMFPCMTIQSCMYKFSEKEHQKMNIAKLFELNTSDIDFKHKHDFCLILLCKIIHLTGEDVNYESFLKIQNTFAPKYTKLQFLYNTQNLLPVFDSTTRLDFMMPNTMNPQITQKLPFPNEYCEVEKPTFD